MLGFTLLIILFLVWISSSLIELTEGRDLWLTMEVGEALMLINIRYKNEDIICRQNPYPYEI